MRRRRSVIVLVFVVAAAFASVALATVPGKNGAIAFRRYFDPQHSWGAIFTIDPSGKGEQQVTRPPRGVADDQPDWSPDGTWIAFTRCAPDTPCAIYMINPGGSHLTRLSPKCAAKPPNIETKCEDGANASFLPDGRHVVYTRATGHVRHFTDWDQIEHSDIVVRDLKGGAPRVLIRSTRYGGDLNTPQFSPDGSRLLYVRANSPLSKPARGQAVFVAGADGRGSHPVTPWSLDAGDNPDWSPDGKLIVFRSHESETSVAQSQIYVVGGDGKGLRPLTHFPTGTNVLSYSFSPDGKWITFAKSGTGGEPDVFVMRTDGTNIQPVTRNPLWDSAPDWGSSH